MRIEKIITYAANAIAEIQNSKVRYYQSVKHFMRKECKILVPSDSEIYMFDKDVWCRYEKDGFIVLEKKKK